MSESQALTYAAREVVAVFTTPEAMEAAVEQLGIAGVDRAAISVLGLGPAPAHRTSFVSHASRVEGEAIAIAFPAQIGGFAGMWAVIAAGGALAAAIGATVAGGVVGAGVGALIFRAIARHHREAVEYQLANGGLVMWVSTPDDAAERRCIDVLAQCGATSVHPQTTALEWGVANSPLHDVQPDPFLTA